MATLCAARIGGVAFMKLGNRSDAVVLDVTLSGQPTSVDEHGALPQSVARAIAENVTGNLHLLPACTGSVSFCVLFPGHTITFIEIGSTASIQSDASASATYKLSLQIAGAVQKKLGAGFGPRAKIESCVQAIEAKHPRDPTVLTRLKGILTEVSGCRSLYKTLEADLGSDGAAAVEKDIDVGLHGASRWARLAEDVKGVLARILH